MGVIPKSHIYRNGGQMAEIVEQLNREIVYAEDLETLTGIPASTWRYWASVGQGPASFKLGRRRVWRRAVVDEWLAGQETGPA
jgi:predicted DNA-binding transcriptional regulator AlpA